MHVIASFNHSIYVEMAITALEEAGIMKENIYAVPLHQRAQKLRMFDSITGSDGTSLFDLGAALATACAVIGSSYGFILTGGPILWGIIGAATGFLVGFTIDVSRQKKRAIAASSNQKSEVIVLVACVKDEIAPIQEVFWEHLAYGVAICE
ncbi:hypothetical protein GCM10008018_28630 [Paenibacillus marchantiophytorum]|uniref:General stress protein 17M-like domain-containing protein n=1 Tax=Paenibacillus marchantiophytorum TaxID=1619310 RepID=A0ABQ1EQ30_9BACL|nr:hypothetical protein [Paenibacillus marchantiophytorum]GFZ81259.1 hypothetical protein GCM10008018_28630 [Paenibacillus marchantiophytorum]